MSNPWFRMYAEAVDDEKLRLIAFEDRWHYVALLCCKCSGLLDDDSYYTSPDLFRRKVAVKLGLATRELDEVARRLAEVGLIDSNSLQPIGWDNRQFLSDSSAERTRKWREKQKKSNAKRHGDVTVTVQDTDTDTDTKDIIDDFPHFELFWQTFADKRGKEAARRVWKRKRLDNIADEVIAGAKRYVATRGHDRKFWKQAQGWLNDGRWADETNQPASKPILPEQEQVFVAAGTAEFRAWQEYNPGVRAMQTQNGYGRWLPSKLPPSTNSEEAA